MKKNVNGLHFITRIDHRDTTGIIGITTYYKEFIPGKRMYYYASSYYSERYKRKTKAFSLTKYGAREALELACQFRINGIGNTDKVRNQIIKEIRSLS